MKKVILSSLVLSTALFACNKADVDTKTVVADTAVTSNKVNEMKRTWFDDGTDPGVIGATFGCVNMGGTCAQGQGTTRSIDIPVFEQMIQEQNFVQVFSEHSSALIPYFTEPMVAGVANGFISVKVKGTYGVDTDAYFVFSKGTDVVNVFPIRK